MNPWGGYRSRPHSDPVINLSVLERNFLYHYIETGSPSQSLKAAGGAGKGGKSQTIRTQAHKMLNRPKVQAALAAIRAKGTEAAAFTLQAHLHKLAEIRDAALKCDQPDHKAAVLAEHYRGRAAGFYVERSISLQGSFTLNDLSPDQRLIRARELMRKMGFNAASASIRTVIGRLAAPGSPVEGQADVLSAASEAKDVSPGWSRPSGTAVHGWEPAGQDPGGERGSGDAPDGEIPAVVDGAEIRDADPVVGGGSDGGIDAGQSAKAPDGAAAGTWNGDDPR